MNMPIDNCSMNISRHDGPKADVGLSIHLYYRNSRKFSIIAIVTGLGITTGCSIPSTNSTIFLGFNIYAEELIISFIHAFIHSAVCLTTGPQASSKAVRFNVSSSSMQYPLFLRYSSSSLRLLHRLSFTSKIPSILSSITCFRRQFLRTM